MKNDNKDKKINNKKKLKNSPSLDDENSRIKSVKVRAKKKTTSSDNSKNRNKDNKKKKINMKKSASTGITSIKVEPASNSDAFESKYDDEGCNMTSSKSSSGSVFDWSRTNTERYSQGNKKRISKSRVKKK